MKKGLKLSETPRAQRKSLRWKYCPDEEGIENQTDHQGGTPVAALEVLP